MCSEQTEHRQDTDQLEADIAIRVSELFKCYQIYDRPQDRLKQSLVSQLQRLSGRTLKQYYREFWALKKVSFEVKKGEAVGVIGRNGSGKSTLLQLICGTLKATTGTIRTNGRIAALLELGSGFNPEFSGRENVYLYGSVFGMSKDEIDARFEAIAAFADIGQFIDQPVKTYSSGMLVRLAFSVIAHVDADILIVDEALAVGDAVFVQKCNNFLRRFKKSGTLFFVSHNMQAVVDLCDRAIWLKDGVIATDGSGKKVVRNYNAYVHQNIVGNQTISIIDEDSRDEDSLETTPIDTGERRLPDIPYSARVHLFDLDAPYWGAGGAEVLNIELFDASGERTSTLHDCGVVTIRVRCRAKNHLEHPIVGFILRNHRGVEIVSENTALGYLAEPPPEILPGQEFYADFTFFLPYMPTGDYFFGGAVADRPQGVESHVQHHRRDDALKVSVLSSHVCYGLLSMPIRACSINVA